MQRSHVLSSFFAVVAVIVCAVSLSWSQAATGKVVGTVTDPAHASIPDATVQVINIATGVATPGKTDKSGHFQVLNLPIGNYNVAVEHAGFQKTITQAQALQINQTLEFDIAMTLGSSEQSVTVEAAVSGVETENATVGATVTGDAIHDLPLNGRNVLNLALLQPGVTPANGGGFSIAGGRPDSITYVLNGGMNNDLLDNGVVFNPNPDTIAEYRLLSSDYTAEYGRNGGGVVTVVTKSGSNALHGSAFDFLRNGSLNANNFFNNFEGLPRDTLKRNQFGATLGGPITIPGVINGKDKLFFFVGYQGQRQSQTQVKSQTPAFTPLEIQGNFSQSNPDGSGTPDPNVAAFLAANPFFQANPALQAQAIIDPTKINSSSAKFLGLGLIPTSTTGLANFTGSQTDNNNQLLGRVDYNLSSRDQVSLTVGGLRDSQFNPFAHANVSGFPDTTTNYSYFTGISATHTFSPDLLNEFHFTVQRHNILQEKPAVNLPSPAALGFGVTPDLPIAPPNVDFDTGLTLGFSIQGPSNLVGTTWIYSDAVSWVHGRNTWKMGGGLSAYQQNMAFDFIGNADFSYAASTGSSGNSYADFLLGIPNFLSEGPNAPSDIRQKTSYGFLQDAWRTTDNLTLTLGLRYEYSTPKRDTQNRVFGIDAGKQSTTFFNAPLGLVFPGDSGVPVAANYPDKDNFAPRIGFAWDPTGHGTTSVRGGVGLFYDVLKAEDNFQFNGQPPFASSVNTPFPAVGPDQAAPVTFQSDPFGATGIPNPFPSRPPSKNLDFALAGFLPFAPPGGVFVNPHIHTPYIYQYNL
ncbi:MAG: carboxypeptidase regulatory-like domain-containing protein, partial [Terriglobales bacterium]